MSSLPNNIYRRCVAWAGQLTSLAKSFAPEHLKDYISSKVEPRDPNAPQYSITLSVDTQAVQSPNYGTLDAPAQEFGSPPHTIRAKFWPWLVFDGTNEFEGKKIYASSVNHPGMEKYQGRGYLKPAIDAIVERGITELSEDVRQAILEDLRMAFSK